ncbi:MAG: PAS domain S-box protein [Limisphaerales bacterium]
MQSANEELQSINEELETSKEELESTNEELTTVNEELAHRNTELNLVNGDLINLQKSTRLSIILLDRDLSIRHFSPKAEKQFNLAGGDVGRPFGKVRHDLDLPDLEKLIAGSIDKVRERECEVRDKQGRWHFLHIRPYISVDNKVDGAVLVLTDITDLKESQQAVTAERDFAESILRTSTDPFLVLDAALRVDRANEAFYNAFRVLPAEVVGRTIFELDHGHWNVPKLRELLNDILPRHSFFDNFEVSTQFQHIGHRTMLLNARSLTKTSGQPPMILLGIKDITELLHYQAELRQSELRFRRIFEASKDGILIINPETCKIMDANPSVSELLGYSREMLLGKRLFEIGVFKDENDCKAAYEVMHSKGFIRYNDLVVETQAGQRRELEFISNLYREGVADVIQCHIRDITERKLAERKFRDLLESAPDAMIITNREGRIELVNAQTERMFGYARGELLGNSVEILIPKRFHDAHPRHRKAFMNDPNARPMGLAMELSGLRKDRTEFPVEVSLSPVESEAGILVSAAVRDITRRKKAEDALRLAQEQLADRARHLESAVAARTADLTAINQQLEAFVYSIAHDLRAPLRAMQGYSAMLLEDEPGLTEAGNHHAERINKAAQFMDALLQDLLAFSRISQLHVELKPVKLDEIVESVLARLQPEIQEKKARVENLGPWPTVLAHESTLTQAIFNLGSNALKFVKSGVQPLLRLSTENKGERVRVWIEDNGIGIEPEYREQVFRLFTRLHGEKYAGTGLGLAIVRQALERMGGEVGVESTPGKGSRFWIELKKS